MTSPSASTADEVNIGKTLCKQSEKKPNDTPEELIFIFHELRFEKIDRRCAHTQTLQVLHKSGEERMVGVELYLACRKTCGVSVSATDGPGSLQRGVPHR